MTPTRRSVDESGTSPSTGAQLVLDALVKRWLRVKHLFGEAAYDRRTLLDKAAYLDFTVEVVIGLQGHGKGDN